MATSGQKTPGQGVLRGVQEKDVVERQRLKEMLANQLSCDLLRLLKEEIQADITFCVGHTLFRAHKAVLRARVPDFSSCALNFNKDGLIHIGNIKPAQFKTFLQVVYSSDRSVKVFEQDILKTKVQNAEDGAIFNTCEKSEIFDTKCCGNGSTPPVFCENGTSNKDGLCLALSQTEIVEENRNGDENEKTLDLAELEPVSVLGEDLFRLYKNSCFPDIKFRIEDELYQVHRAILCARSNYFSAMLSGCWAESSQDHITLQGQVLSIADMYGLEGLKEMAIYILKRDYCKFFHKPIGGLHLSVLECLTLARLFGLKSLYASCMRWIGKHFVKCLSEKNFSSLPDDLQENCLTTLIQSLDNKNAAFFLMESDRLISSLPGVKWAEKTHALASRLQEECITFIVTNFPKIIKSESFYHLLQAQGMSTKPYLLEKVFNAIEKNINTENGCIFIIALDSLMNLTSAREMDFTCTIQALRDKLWIFLVQSYYAVRHTESWKLMSTDDQQKIQSAAFDKGDDRRLGKKPVFTSSQLNQCVAEPNIKQTSWKANSRKDCWVKSSTNQVNMKSDGLGASGHTSASNRNTSNKVAKHDDLKGKDTKKAVPITTKDAKCVGKTATAKPKAAVKPKAENNGNSDSLVPKQDSERSVSVNGQRQSTNGKGITYQEGKNSGARPKVQGSSSVHIKTKPLKKNMGKELASQVASAGSAKKSSNAEKDVQISNECSEDPREDVPVGEHKLLHSLQGDTSKNHMESSKDPSTALKSKSIMKMTNGISTKKKENGVQSSGETNGVTKKPAGKGCSEQNLQGLLKKGITSGPVYQRAKSTPVTLFKTHGLQDTTDSLKANQSEEKFATKPLDHSALLDKQDTVKRKSLKSPYATSIKTIKSSTVPLSKNLTHSLKVEIGHKELKQKNLNRPSIAKSQSPIQRRTHSETTIVKNMQGEVFIQKDSGKKCHSQTMNSVHLPDNNKSNLSIQNQSEAILYNTAQVGDTVQNTEASVPNISKESEHNFENEKIKLNSDTYRLTELEMSCGFETANKNSANKSTDCPNTVKIYCTAENSSCALSDTSGKNTLECKADSDRGDYSRHMGCTKGCALHLIKETQNIGEQKGALSLVIDIPYNKDLLDTSLSVHDGRKPCNTLFEDLGTDHFPDKLALGDHELTSNSDSATNRFTDLIPEKSVSGSPREMDTTETPESHENSETPFVDHWNLSTGVLHHKESPESDTGSATTSSDDIKPRSEDYDAGGSQDDDGSNERGISKCSTMLCHDFLGRSSSDTSTPEELKVYDSSLRIEVKMKKDNSADLYRVTSTSDDEGPRKRPEIWSHQDDIIMNEAAKNENACANAQFIQEAEQVSSSADETEDERSEAENVVENCSPSEKTSQPFQGIVNLAFDDTTENDNKSDNKSQEFSTTKNFKRSVLLSVDECEELGSDEGETQTPLLHSTDSPKPSDVFDSVSCEQNGRTYSGYPKEIEGYQENKQDKEKDKKSDKIVNHFLESSGTEHLGKDKQDAIVTAETNDKINTEVEGKKESQQCNKLSDHEIKCQERPCHLDLHQRDPNSDMQQYNSSAKVVDPCRSQPLTHEGQVKENQTVSAENTNTTLSTGDIDDCDTLAHTCMYEQRLSKTLSPIYEMDVGEAIETKIEAETHILDMDFEDQHFVERDWTLLRQLLSDQDSNIDIKNTLPEDVSLAQYLINQTLFLSRDSSKPQGKAHIDTFSKWTELMSPPDDSTESLTVTSFSPDNCSSPHGEWTILELETHH
uniref:BTB/POZ domain-containing protein 8 isoform X2 n=1 Tax=Geotrypetes seraphini TaxID=260995 RepID=A0A6P8PC52_GEOSA|nr:BTB/POZ domain-containing protein 8 isoform X2 [Geotrypetes seraphini]